MTLRYSKYLERQARLERERERDPYRYNEMVCRQLVSLGRFPYAQTFRLIKQGAFTPGSSGTYSSIRVICCRDFAPQRDRPYSVHTAVIVSRPPDRGGTEVHLIHGMFDLTREEAERHL